MHVIVAGGGLSADGSRWIACRPGFFLPVKVLSRLFLQGLIRSHKAGKLNFFGELSNPPALCSLSDLPPLHLAMTTATTLDLADEGRSLLGVRFEFPTFAGSVAKFSSGSLIA